MGDEYVHDPKHFAKLAEEKVRAIFDGHEHAARVSVDRPTVEGLFLAGVRAAEKHYHIGAPLGPGD